MKNVLTSLHRWVVTASAPSGGEEGGRQVSQAWFWEPLVNCWKTSVLALVWSFLLIVEPAQEKTNVWEILWEERCSWCPSTELFSSDTAALPRLTAPCWIPQYLASIKWKALGYICFLGAFPKAGGKCLFKTSDKPVQNKHAAMRPCGHTRSAQVPESLQVWMRQTNK